MLFLPAVPGTIVVGDGRGVGVDFALLHTKIGNEHSPTGKTPVNFGAAHSCYTVSIPTTYMVHDNIAPQIVISTTRLYFVTSASTGV